MAYSRELLDRILKRADIVAVISSYIPVTKKGREYLAVCPFHDDKHPSLHISPERQFFKCFVDGTGGNCFDFVMKYEHVSFPEAVKKVAAIAGISDPELERESGPRSDPKKTPLYACAADLSKYYRYSLSTAEGKEAMEYLSKRGLGEREIDAFGIGYAPLDGEKTVSYLRAKGHTPKTIEGIGVSAASDDMRDRNAGRLVFTLFDPEGRPVGFSARRMGDGDTPKYINTSETLIFHKSELLYNYHAVKDEARRLGHLYVLEGFMDVIALYQIGEPAVAVMGTALTTAQIGLLRKTGAEIRLCLDGDKPGQTAMMAAVKPLTEGKISFRIVESTTDEDPDDLYRRAGEAGLRERLENLVDPFRFQLSYYVKSRKLETAEERQKVANHFLPYIGSIPEGIEREDALQLLSQATSYSVEALRRMARTSKRAEAEPLPDPGGGEIRRPTKKMGKLERAERSILYYMLSNPEAVKYFEENVDYFYTPIYQEIANYIVDYAAERPGSIDLQILLLDIESSDHADLLKSEVIDIAGERHHPPYSEKLAESAKAAIDEGKRKIHEEQEEDSLYNASRDEAEKALNLEKIAEQKRERLRKKNQ